MKFACFDVFFRLTMPSCHPVILLHYLTIVRICIFAPEKRFIDDKHSIRMIKDCADFIAIAVLQIGLNRTTFAKKLPCPACKSRRICVTCAIFDSFLLFRGIRTEEIIQQISAINAILTIRKVVQRYHPVFLSSRPHSFRGIRSPSGRG